MTYKKKLLEVALPLEDINPETAREEPITGKPCKIQIDRFNHTSVWFKQTL